MRTMPSTRSYLLRDGAAARASRARPDDDLFAWQRRVGPGVFESRVRRDLPARVALRARVRRRRGVLVAVVRGGGVGIDGRRHDRRAACCGGTGEQTQQGCLGSEGLASANVAGPLGKKTPIHACDESKKRTAEQLACRPTARVEWHATAAFARRRRLKAAGAGASLLPQIRRRVRSIRSRRDAIDRTCAVPRLSAGIVRRPRRPCPPGEEKGAAAVSGASLSPSRRRGRRWTRRS